VKRFYKSVRAARQGDAFVVTLDGKPMKTPGGALLAVRSQRLADAVAAEWDQRDSEIDLETMPLTKLAHAAIDGASRRTEIAAHVLKFGRSDLVFYRAAEPAELAEREARAWDPPLAWLSAQYRAEFVTGTGMRFIEQPAQALSALETTVSRRDEYQLVALFTATTILGSLVLALALADGKLDAATAFAAAHVDESFQAEKWGRDTQAEKRLARLAFELKAAERFLRAL
jgi:chaperone required for assembly of F1-ATPase